MYNFFGILGWKKNKIIYQDQYKFTYQLGERSRGHVITDCLNDIIKENETTVCNDMNEEYNLGKKMKGRQLLKIIYSKEKLTNEFKELSLEMLHDDEDVVKVLNEELSTQHETYHPDYCSICKERPLISYYRGISILDVDELLDNDDAFVFAIEITNKIRTKVRRTLRKNYRKFMKQSDLQAIERALFQYYDENFVDEFWIDLTDDDMAELDEIFGNQNNITDDSGDWGEPVSMEGDFSIEEMLDMPVMSDIQPA